jgi:dTDP-glucose 4,6-dehydratase
MIAISGSHGFVASKLASLLKLKPIPRDLLRKPKALIDCLSSIDTVIHTAVYGNFSFQKGDKKTFRVNVIYTFNILDAAKKAGVKNFIYFSSSYELGTKQEPMQEDMVARPETIYGITKACGTQLTRHFSKFMNTAIVRPFSVTGIGEQDYHLIPTLIRSCLYGEKIPFVPEPVHDYIDVFDLCQGVILVLKNIEKHNGEIFHLGCGKQYTNQEVLEIVEKMTGKKANIEIVDSMRDYDSKFWMADNTKLKSLGWKQIKTLEQSIKEMIDYELKKKNN